MKHQYFGDVSDYKKYGVLRALSNNGNIKTMVAWMLTPNDTRSDGNNNGYLQKPELWKKHEPDIFDFLYESVVTNKIKDLHLVEKNALVPHTGYFFEPLLDDIENRIQYFDQLKKASDGFDIVFLDPDNGFATKSAIKGKKNSSKYVFWDELLPFWEKGHTLMIYQHFPRVNRESYIKKLSEQIREIIDVPKIYAIKTTHMVYFLIPQEKHIKEFVNLKNKLKAKWPEVIEVWEV